jgi:tRNA pseudouridine38-40 synthase
MAKKKRHGAKKRVEGMPLYALLIAYTGTNFYGVQIQTNTVEHPSIENIILDALGDLQLIERDKGTKDLSWHRASRTDKGVHAVRNILVTRLQQKNT